MAVALVLPLLSGSLLPAASAASAAADGVCAGRADAVTGYVGSASAPLPAAEVVVHADPDLADLRVGESARLPRLGSATTDAAGCFTIPARPDWAAAAASAGGVLDLRVTVHRPGGLELRVVPVVVARTAAGDLRLRPGDGASGPGVRARFTGEETASPAAGAIATTSGGAAAASIASAPAPPVVADALLARAPGQLRWVKKADYGKRPVLVGQWWSKNPGTVERWIYSKGATSALEAAFTLAGEHGVYAHSETNSTAITSTVKFPRARGKAGKLYRTYFGYGRFVLQQYDYVSGKWVYIGTWVRRTSWERGTQVTSNVPVPPSSGKHCAPYLRDSEDTTQTSAAVTWSDGVQLSGRMKAVLGGVTLSSRTGFTDVATNHVRFATRRGRLCGVYGPLSAPGALLARK